MGPEFIVLLMSLGVLSVGFMDGGSDEDSETETDDEPLDTEGEGVGDGSLLDDETDAGSTVEGSEGDDVIGSEDPVEDVEGEDDGTEDPDAEDPDAEETPDEAEPLEYIGAGTAEDYIGEPESEFIRMRGGDDEA